MQAIIRNKLQQIEQDEDIKILYACESGSRGWGFMKKILFLLATLLPVCLRANGDPTDQASALHRSSNPTPRTITDIQMLREELRIKPGIHTSVSVKYVLLNTSDKDYKDIDYGFPVDYGGVGEKYVNSPIQRDYYSDSGFAMGWHDDYEEDSNNFDYQPVSLENLLERAMVYNLPQYDLDKITKIEFTIKKIYPGTYYEDTCISEIILLDNGVYFR